MSVGDHLVRADRAGRRLDLGVGGIGPAVGDRVAHGARRTGTPPAGRCPSRWRYAARSSVRRSVPVDQHRARGRVVEAGDQLDHRRLAGAGLPDQGDRLARLDEQRDSTRAARRSRRSRRSGRRAARSRPRSPRDRQRVGRLGRRGRRAQQVAQPAQPDRGLLVAVEHLRQLLDRARRTRPDRGSTRSARRPSACRAASRTAPNAEHQRRRRHRTGTARTGSRSRCSAGPAAASRGSACAEPRNCSLLRPSRPNACVTAHAGDVLLELGVDRADPFARLDVGRDGEAAERQVASRSGSAASRPGSATAGRPARSARSATPTSVSRLIKAVVRPGLQEVRQRVDVGRHPGHDPAAELALVVVQAESLQLGECLDPQV